MTLPVDWRNQQGRNRLWQSSLERSLRSVRGGGRNGLRSARRGDDGARRVAQTPLLPPWLRESQALHPTARSLSARLFLRSLGQSYLPSHPSVVNNRSTSHS